MDRSDIRSAEAPLFSAPAEVGLPKVDVQGPEPFHTLGELIAFEPPPGRNATLRFHDAYETFLILEGDDGTPKRVLRHESLDARIASLWVHRRLLPLWRILSDKRGLVLRVGRRGVFVTDLVQIDGYSGETRALHHARLRTDLAPLHPNLPRFCVLGAPANRAELQSRLRTVFAAGQEVEVRDEDDSFVLRRWRATC